MDGVYRCFRLTLRCSIAARTSVHGCCCFNASPPFIRSCSLVSNIPKFTLQPCNKDQWPHFGLAPTDHFVVYSGGMCISIRTHTTTCCVSLRRMFRFRQASMIATILLEYGWKKDLKNIYSRRGFKPKPGG